MLRKDAVLIDRNLTFQGSIFSVKNFPAESLNLDSEADPTRRRLFFSGYAFLFLPVTASLNVWGLLQVSTHYVVYNISKKEEHSR